MRSCKNILFFIYIAQFLTHFIVDIDYTRCYTKLIKGKEVSIMDFYEDLGMFYAGYESYVRDMQEQGKKPVSVLSYVLGRY